MMRRLIVVMFNWLDVVITTAHWRQKSCVFAYRWGVLEYEVEEVERPQFQGSYEVYDESLGKKYDQFLSYMCVIVRLVYLHVNWCLCSPVYRYRLVFIAVSAVNDDMIWYVM